MKRPNRRFYDLMRLQLALAEGGFVRNPSKHKFRSRKRDAMARQLETCENCGRTIGALETPHVHNDHVVCAECAGHLARSPSSAPSVPELRTPRRGEIICPNPNCGYIGKPKKQARGSMAVGCLLCLLMLLPGLIYFALMSGYTYLCPRCGYQIRSGTHN